MTIDTRIAGNPQSVWTVSDWLRNDLGREISEAVDSIYTARNSSDAGWDGTTGDAFSARMNSGAQHADTLSTAVTDVATAFDAYAAQLHSAQTDMAHIRATASEAGLVVRDFLIESPGMEPADPGTSPGVDATPNDLERYQAAVAAQSTYRWQKDAYEAADAAASSVRGSLKLATDTLKNMWADITSKWFFVIGDLINGAAGALAAGHVSTMAQNSVRLADEARVLLDRAINASPGTSARDIYDDFDRSRLLTRQADEIAESARNAEQSASRIGMKVGGALGIGGIAYDIANGKPIDQAIVSGGLGFGASVLAGAAIGSFVPVPVLGSALGALGGATVGLFTSGAIDSIYQNGIDSVGDVIGDGFDAVGNTGQALGGLVADGWNAVFD